MLHHLGYKAAGEAVEQAIIKALQDSELRTPDMGGKATNRELGAVISEAV